MTLRPGHIGGCPDPKDGACICGADSTRRPREVRLERAVTMLSATLRQASELLAADADLLCSANPEHEERIRHASTRVIAEIEDILKVADELVARA